MEKFVFTGAVADIGTRTLIHGDVIDAETRNSLPEDFPASPETQLIESEVTQHAELV